jgi:hypothetical protein
VPFEPPTAGLPAYDGRTHAELIAAAEPITERVLTTASLVTPEGVGTLVGVIAGGGSIVLCRNLDPSLLDRRIADEKIDRALEDN